MDLNAGAGAGIILGPGSYPPPSYFLCLFQVLPPRNNKQQLVPSVTSTTPRQLSPSSQPSAWPVRFISSPIVTLHMAETIRDEQGTSCTRSHLTRARTQFCYAHLSTHTRTHARAHTRTHAHTHTYTHNTDRQVFHSHGLHNPTPLLKLPDHQQAIAIFVWAHVL